MNTDAREQLRSSGVTVLQYDQVWSHLKTWGQELEQRRKQVGSKPDSPAPRMPEEDDKGSAAKPTYKASLSGKTSWAIAEALGKVCYTMQCSRVRLTVRTM
jgi:hypothetical protein